TSTKWDSDMASLPIQRITPEEYLRLERSADFKSEYISGEMVAMSGASFPHGVIVNNVSGELYSQLKGRSCQTITNDMRVHWGAAFLYPDVVVVCGKPELVKDGHLDNLTNPSVIIEVLSPSTENYDRGLKFMRYGQIPTLTNYILIAQDEPRIDHFIRQQDG